MSKRTPAAGRLVIRRDYRYPSHPWTVAHPQGNWVARSTSWERAYGAVVEYQAHWEYLLALKEGRTQDAERYHSLWLDYSPQAYWWRRKRSEALASIRAHLPYNESQSGTA